MKIDVLTLFPKMFENVISESMMKRARQKELLHIKVHDLRDWTEDSHRSADDKPFGGGAGMIMKVEPIYRALKGLGFLKKRPSKAGRQKSLIILLTPRGAKFSSVSAKALAKKDHLVFICGHYEGVDERVRELIDLEISIGDYVLTGGELPAMVVMDALMRHIPGVLGSDESLSAESFEDNMLEYPQYTRPSDFLGMKVPEVLLSGNHKKIEEWRQKEALHLTKNFRPDLIKKKKG